MGKERRGIERKVGRRGKVVRKREEKSEEG